MEDINWEKIQEYYDDNHTWKDIQVNFNISSYMINKASKNKKLKIRSRSEANKLANIKSPRKLSDETKKKISESRKKYLMENPDKVPYLLNHYSKGPSYPENYFDKIFKNKFKYEKYLQVGLYHIDFAVINRNIAIEIDGEQHYLDKKIVESDKRKNRYLNSKGWDIIRIRWSDYQKLNREEREEYISNLINYINNLIKIKPEIERKDKQNYCKCGKKIHKRSKMCIRCVALKQKRKVKNRPSKEELLKMIKESSYEFVAIKYNVSSNSIRKWLK